MIVFRILSGGKEGKIIKSDLDVIYAGRKPECILQLDPYQDLSVHGQHAKIYSSNGNYYLEDLNSKNGTFVQEQAIKTPIQLKRGLIFRLGVDGPEIEIYNCKTNSSRITNKQQNSFLLKRLDKDTVFNFNKKSVRIGRQPDCELALDPLKNRAVSGYHTLICCREDGYHLEDLQSANGTFLNDLVCKNSKLKHLDIIQLGKEGPKFQFLYENINTLSNADSVISVNNKIESQKINIENETKDEEVSTNAKEDKEKLITPKIRRTRKKKKESRKITSFPEKAKIVTIQYAEKIKDSHLYEIITENFKKYKKESIILGVLFFVFIIVLFGAFGQKTYNKENLHKTYNKIVVPIYTRYLIRINGKLIRGQQYSNGIIYIDSNKTIIKTLIENIFPWKNTEKINDKIETIVHIVAIWPKNHPIFIENNEPSGLDFSYSYNNDQNRVGGLGNIIINEKNNNPICQIEILNKIEGLLFKEDIVINDSLDEEKNTVYAMYTSPDNVFKNQGSFKKIIVKGYNENKKVVLNCSPNGAPIFNTYGEILGLFSKDNIIAFKNKE